MGVFLSTDLVRGQVDVNLFTTALMALGAATGGAELTMGMVDQTRTTHHSLRRNPLRRVHQGLASACRLRLLQLITTMVDPRIEIPELTRGTTIGVHRSPPTPRLAPLKDRVGTHIMETESLVDTIEIGEGIGRT